LVLDSHIHIHVPGMLRSFRRSRRDGEALEHCPFTVEILYEQDKAADSRLYEHKQVQAHSLSAKEGGHSSSSSSRGGGGGGGGAHNAFFSASRDRREEDVDAMLRHVSLVYHGQQHLLEKGRRDRADRQQMAAKGQLGPPQHHPEDNQFEFVDDVSISSSSSSSLGSSGGGGAGGGTGEEEEASSIFLRHPRREAWALDTWTPREIALFEAGMVVVGRDFSQIQEIIPGKSTNDCAAFYYDWKRSTHYHIWYALYPAAAAMCHLRLPGLDAGGVAECLAVAVLLVRCVSLVRAYEVSSNHACVYWGVRAGRRCATA
jgi:hypothetical protein